LESFVTRLKQFLLLGLTLFAIDGGTSARASEGTLYRDVWGVPHVVSDTEAGAMFALGYAQAEDRLEDIYLAVRTAIGRMSEVRGMEMLQQDYMMRLAHNDTLHAPYLATAPAELRTNLQAFVAGIQAYIDQHPDEASSVAIPIEAWHPLAVGRAMILRWPLGTIMGDLGNAPERPKPAMGSNQWAVAPSRSADGSAILLSDPHLTWEGLAVLYEARFHGGELHMNGFYLIGSPMLAIGHNQRVGWALTTGGPDTSDVYRMQFRSEPALEYHYDAAWRPVRVETFEIPIRGGDVVTKAAYYTHLGPVVSEPDAKTGVAYVGASPYLEQTGLYQQFYDMAKATDVMQFNQVLAAHQYNEQNVMSADVLGNIAYVRNGATPIRPDGYDWTRPVDGTTSATAWKGIHPQSDLVHLLNPASGYMQNCNISPANMMVDSPLTPDRYPPYIYNVSWDLNNPRGRRTVELLDRDSSVTEAEAIDYAMDIYDGLAERWQAELRAAWSQAEPRHRDAADMQRAVEAMLAWDGHYTPQSQSTVLFKFWRLQCGASIDLAPIGRGERLPAESQSKLLDTLAETMKLLIDRYGRWDVAWGQVHVVGRGGQYFPVGGADYSSGSKEGNFSETLLDVKSVESKDQPGLQIANSGSMAMILMFFDPDTPDRPGAIRSFTCTPWGQSAHPESKHFVDQGRDLYSQRRMKPTWWNMADLQANHESKTVLRYDAK
jgi:acyl-homoserine-lactone acylase